MKGGVLLAWQRKWRGAVQYGCFGVLIQTLLGCAYHPPQVFPSIALLPIESSLPAPMVNPCLQALTSDIVVGQVIRTVCDEYRFLRIESHYVSAMGLRCARIRGDDQPMTRIVCQREEKLRSSWHYVPSVSAHLP